MSSSNWRNRSYRKKTSHMLMVKDWGSVFTVENPIPNLALALKFYKHLIKRKYFLYPSTSSVNLPKSLNTACNSLSLIKRFPSLFN